MAASTTVTVAQGTAASRSPVVSRVVSLPPPEQWSLPLLYLVFAIDVALLYGACRWYAGVKAAGPRWWMRYA